MKSNFERCLAETLAHEGGWADHPQDPGGATMKGVTLAVYRQYKPGATKAQLRAISDADLRHIYRVGYWDTVRGDDLPEGLDMVVFDGAVNSGPSRGARWLQEALGVPADGKVGPVTIAAAQKSDRRAVINAALDRRLSFVQGLRTWVTFGRGWTRRIAAVRAVALAMAAEAPSAPQPSTSPLAALWRALAAIFRRQQ